MRRRSHETRICTVLGLAAAVCLGPACATDDDDDRGMGGVIPPPGGTDDDWGDDGDRWDVGGGGGTGNGGDNMDDGCKKVDLLFVIDDSGSMADEQQNLVSSFPGFIEAIRENLAGTNGYNVGVITSDAYIYNESSCTMEGALVTQTGGVDASNQQCGPFALGKRYMTEHDDLATKFACAAQVGTGGDGNERPMQTAIAALSDTMNGAGACNEGFIRDDALLVLVIITDEEDDHEQMGACATYPPQAGSIGDPADWFDAIVEAKGGVESNVVVLGLIGPEGADKCPELDKCGNAIDGSDVAPRLVEFTEMWTYGSVGPVCAPSYESFFADSVGLIESACDDFNPTG